MVYSTIIGLREKTGKRSKDQSRFKRKSGYIWFVLQVMSICNKHLVNKHIYWFTRKEMDCKAL